MYVYHVITQFSLALQFVIFQYGIPHVFFSILLSSNPMPSLFVFIYSLFEFFHLAKKFLNFFGVYDMLLPESGNVPLSTFRKRAKKRQK